MSDYIFLFDMDSTITQKEVLPEVSKRIGKLEEMRRLTEATMRGEIPFRTSFLNRVKILSDISVAEVNQVVSEIPLNPYIAEFIEQNRDRCYVVTGNLDVWISGLMKKLKMENHCYCSKADVINDRISKVVSVADKELMVRQFVQPMVVIGDGDNDSGMARMADIAIGFGGVRPIAQSLLRNADFAFYEDKRYRAVRKLRTEPTEEHLWEVVLLYAGVRFKTYSGLPFTYEIRKGRNGQYTKELWIDRRENSKSLAWSSVLLALGHIKKVGEVVERPKALGDIRGVTYIYGMFYRFGLINVPDEAKEKMKKAFGKSF